MKFTRMIRRFVLIGLCFSAGNLLLLFLGNEGGAFPVAGAQGYYPETTYGEVVFLCGWKRQNTNFDTEIALFEQEVNHMYQSSSPSVEYHAIHWTWRAGSDDQEWYEFESAYQNALEDGYSLAKSISELPVAQQRNLVLIGHSLGAVVAVRAMAILNDNGIRIRKAFLFGACVRGDSADIPKAAAASIEPIVNMIHPQDGALMLASAKYLFPYPMLGTGLVVDVDNFKEVLICSNELLPFGSEVTNASEIYEKYQNNHSLSTFINGWRSYLRNDQHPLYGEVIVPQGLPNVKVQVMGGDFFWEVLDHYGEWKLQKNSISGHCRILGPYNYRFASGSTDCMTKSFGRVKKQLYSPQPQSSSWW